jgi:hypothetical protein
MIPAPAVMEDVPPHTVLVPGLAREPLGVPAPHVGRDQQPGRPEQTMELEQPRERVVGEVGEDRNRPDEVERAVLESQRRILLALPGVERRAQVPSSHSNLHDRCRRPRAPRSGPLRESGAAYGRRRSRKPARACPRTTNHREATGRLPSPSGRRSPRRPGNGSLFQPVTENRRLASSNGGYG